MIYTLTSDIFDIFTMNIFFNTIFQKRNKNIPYPIFISFFVLYEFIGFITNSYFNLSGSKHLYIVSLVSILTIFLLTFLYNANLKLRLLSAISYHVLGGLSEVVIYIIISYFPKEDRAKILSQNGICLAISQILFFVFIMFAVLFVKRKKSELLTLQYSILILFTPVLTNILILSISNAPKNNIFHKTMNTLAIIGLLAANIVNYFLLDSLLKIKELEITKKQLNDKLEYQTKKYLLLSTTYKNSRKIIHDVKKHYFFIRECLHKQHYSEIDDYINTSIGDMEQTFNRINTGNLVIDAFISNYINMAKAEGIQLNTNIKINAKTIPVKDYDLCIIIGNLMDNSFNAVRKITNANSRHINIDLYTDDFQFVVHVKNTRVAVDAEKEKKIDPNEYYHGYGITNIINTSDKYKGVYSCYTESEIFETIIIYPIITDTELRRKLNIPENF